MMLQSHASIAQAVDLPAPAAAAINPSEFASRHLPRFVLLRQQNEKAAE